MPRVIIHGLMRVPCVDASPYKYTKKKKKNSLAIYFQKYMPENVGITFQSTNSRNKQLTIAGKRLISGYKENC